jgi:hypothetical protein
VAKGGLALTQEGKKDREEKREKSASRRENGKWKMGGKSTQD